MRHVSPQSLTPDPEFAFALAAPPNDGPVYPRLPQLDKWRALANSAKGATDEQDRAYGRAVLAAIRALNGVTCPQPIPLKSTAWTVARQRAEHIAELHRGVAADRARRTDAEIIAAYEQAMQEKRTALEERAKADAARKALAAAKGNKPMDAATSDETLLAGHSLEHERARAWREARGLSRAQLAERIGFSASQIQDYEEGGRRGKTGAAAEISEAAWRRYRLACAAIAADLPEAW